jgi:hypothetical protein
MPGNPTQKNFFFLLIALTLAFFALWGCAPQVNRAYQGPTDECGPIEPAEEDIRFALSIGQDLFSKPEWVKSYTVEPYQVRLTRLNDTESAVAYIEYLMYNCGYGQADLDERFSEASFAIVFQDYESHVQTNFCEDGDLALYEYDLVNEEYPYAARYWAKQQSDTRILIVMLVFPRENPSLMNTYATRLFPDLSSCGDQP